MAKTFTLNEKNFNMIFGMLKKHLDGKSVNEYHCWGGGFKKRVKNQFINSEYNIVITEEPNILSPFINKRDEKTIHIRDHIGGFCIYYGDKIRFCGNRIEIALLRHRIFQDHRDMNHIRNLYVAFQYREIEND